MKPALFALLALALSPAIARADLVYKCKTAKPSDEKTATLRFGEFGRSGGIEVEHWSGYPPISLVSGELKTPTHKDGQTIFLSEIDTLWGYSAELVVPSSFLRMDFFEASITLIKGGRRAPIAFNCNRF
jgi:hypothetical protein